MGLGVSGVPCPRQVLLARLVWLVAQRAPMDLARKGSAAWFWAIVAVAAALLCAGALLRPINHDESQYVAAAALMRSGLPYRDFAYLQTPLQPLLLAPLAWLPPGWLLVGARLVNVGLASAALLVTAVAVRRNAPGWAVTLAIAGMACTEAFLFAGSIARNDALPLALLAGGMALLLRGGRPLQFAAAGLCLGLAVSAKISFLLPAMGAGVFLLWEGRRTSWRPAIAAGAGVAVGLLPTLCLAVVAPPEFRFGVFTYNLQAPQQWYQDTGRILWLQPSGKLHRLWELGSAGPIVPALLTVLVHRSGDARCRLLDLMIVGGAAAAYLPSPTQTQYLVPLLPPLFARAALALAGLRTWQRGLLVAFGLWTVSSGLKPSVQAARESAVHGAEIREVLEQAGTVRDLARGPVATLSPERVAGDGVILDPRFAAGPFLFRTRGALAAEAETLGRSVVWQRLDALARSAPPAILTGGERRQRPPIHPQGLDGHLVGWAKRNGYRPHPLGSGFVLWLRPQTERAAPKDRPLFNPPKDQRE